MLLPVLLLAGLRGLLAAGPGFQSSFLQIVFPEKIQASTSDNSKMENEQISYIIPIDMKPYTVHLKQRYFLGENFMIYQYNQGSVTSRDSSLQTNCYYQGNVEGYPSAVVTLSTCSGLRGILQFENVSFGIEPLESAVEYHHLLYKLMNKNNISTILAENNQDTEQKTPMNYKIFISEKFQPAFTNLIPLYLEMHIVVDKLLYDYLGSDSIVATKKVIEIISLINSMFAQFKVTIVLSSLELWSDENKISTAVKADALLHAFLEWKDSYLTLRPHDIAYLFIYRDHPDYVGATFPGKMCVTNYSAGIALYPKEMTLEAFSVIVTQMLGLSLGMSYDDPKKCHCSGAICIMNPEALRYSGVKTFSNCSLNDFGNFISNMGARCLQNKPQLQIPAAFCGNGKVEGNEACDCGTVAQCGPNSCCEPRTCTLRHGAQCGGGVCCRPDCQFQNNAFECRPRAHPECDIPEFCNGSSGSCTPDITIHNGRLCEQGKFMCYDGKCHDLDARCETLFGKGSKNAPFPCYEEIQYHNDRFGNCGIDQGRFITCSWRNLICGRLICTYPTQVPYQKENISVIYAFVRDTTCITIDYRLPRSVPDPMQVYSGSACDTGRVCVNHKCVEAKYVREAETNCSVKCRGQGVCNSKLECHCFPGFRGHDCSTRSRKASEFPVGPDLIAERTSKKTEKTQWLLGVYTFVPTLFIAVIIAVSWSRLKKRFIKEEETSLNSESEDSAKTNASRSTSENSNPTDGTRSETSVQTETSRSKSQEST
ncbi:disintegrin and metalloproteinase domain-containing protein 32-like [Erinaceus europaeus]|uniref:Disintegrin and metalloproteinase domain-containing protein 32-like n=1 Tax=Erinaceus europaeus TaxID=9365 RepID=A0ABM3WP05_ERIEU|nr:disintegrin and metalloproteinase domain-containing protein 32-like [Erinaceus europaeus]